MTRSRISAKVRGRNRRAGGRLTNCFGGFSGDGCIPAREVCLRELMVYKESAIDESCESLAAHQSGVGASWAKIFATSGLVLGIRIGFETITTLKGEP
jgi:hypothetical protein